MNFLRNLLAAILGFFIAIGLLFMFFIAIAAAFGSQDKVQVKPSSVLEISLDKKVLEYLPKGDDPFQDYFEGNKHKMGLSAILNAIENAKTDANIKGISIVGQKVNTGIAQLQAIRKKIEEFKESGKFVYAYADGYSQKGYYLSSVADSVYINPVGILDFQGLSTELLFFKDFQEKSGVKFEVIRHGKYKSAVEPFISNKMSDANREQIKSFLTSIWQTMIADVAKSRQTSVEKLQTMADELAIRTPEMALNRDMVDGIKYPDEYDESLKEGIEISSSSKLNTISISDYIESGKGRLIKTAANKIAVLHAQGEIIYGKGDEEHVGQVLMTNALRKIRKDKNIKALVLRINSPGGSALASDMIWREIELLKEKMPVVVSMSDLAASGGYYIACGAHKIYAEPTTITGSIGVFGILPNFYSLSQKMGINSERVSTNKSAYYSPFKPMDEGFEEVVTEGVETIYKTFVNRVAEGRKMSFEEVNKIAQGRVWSGEEALRIGLVDELGGIDQAIAHAAELAEISSYKLRSYPSYKKDFEELFKNPFAQIKTKMMQEELGEAYGWYQQFKQLSKKQGVQARVPFIINIE